MLTLLKGAEVYSPEYKGRQDVLLAGDRIAQIESSIPDDFPVKLDVVDASGLIMTPGFIDQHVHITGGGGEGGFATRTPEIEVQDLLESGITTVVGILGTDGVTRSLEDLYAKVKALETAGMNAYMYTGSYQVPVMTLTGSIQRDLVLIDKAIGVGEIAVSDHRSSAPTAQELAKIAAAARVGGLISGKAGVVHLHLGDNPRGLEPVFGALETASVPIGQFVPSHVNRRKGLLDQAVEFAQRGGVVDLTAGFEPGNALADCIPAYQAIGYLLDAGIEDSRITMSSDGNGSLPSFDESGNLVGIAVGSCRVMLGDFRKAILDLGLPKDLVLKIITSNPARVLKLDQQIGTIEIGKQADLVLMDKGLNIKLVFVRGKKVVQDGRMQM